MNWMIPFVFLSAVTRVAAAHPAPSSPAAPRFVGEIQRVSPKLDALIAPDSRIEMLAEGFDWSEGPVWVSKKRAGSAGKGFLLFSDVPRNTIYRWREGQGVDVYLTPSGFTGQTASMREPGSNGLLLDPNGNLLICQHGDRRVARMLAPLDAPAAQFETVAGAWQGREFNSPNDLAFGPGGQLYFTDPPYGRAKGANDPGREIDFFGVFRVDGKGQVHLVTREMTRPNGIAFSPDRKTLYVAQSWGKAPVIQAWDVGADGQVSNSRVLVNMADLKSPGPGGPDGLKVDRAGNLFCTGPGGVLVFSSDGEHLGTIRTGQRTANCAFGEDGKTLFMTADGQLLRLRLQTTGDGF